MKKIILALLIVGIGISASARDNAAPTTEKKKHNRVRPEKCPVIYITTSTGINNNTAILGFSFDMPVSKNVSIEAGPGTGTWGNKLFVGSKYYLSPCHRGFAFGVGFTYCPGVYHDNANLTTVYGNTEDVEYNKNPLTNIVFAAYKYWNLGKKHNRVFAELGWSMLLTAGERITQVSGDPISSGNINSLDSDAPGGPIAAVGISFGL